MLLSSRNSALLFGSCVATLRKGLLLSCLLLSSGSFLAPTVQAAPDARLIRYLKQNPTDREKLTGLLKRAIKGEHYENVFVLSRHLVKIGVKNAKVLRVLGVAAYKIGRMEDARQALKLAIREDPSDQKAQSYLTAIDRGTGEVAGFMTGTTGEPEATPTAPADSTSPDYKQAYSAFYDDQVDRALRFVELSLAKNPGDLETMLLKARILQSQTSYEEAEAILEKMATDHPASAVVRARLGEYYHTISSLVMPGDEETRKNRLALAYVNFKQALELDPQSRTARLLFVAFLHAEGSERSRTQADQIYRDLEAQRPFVEREQVLTDATIQLAREAYDDCLKTTESYMARFGADSQILLLEGITQLRLRNHEKAAENFELAFRRNSKNLGMALQVAPLLATVGQADRALKIIALAEAEFPEETRLGEMKKMLQVRVVTDKDFVTAKRGVFEYHYPRLLQESDPEAFKRIEQHFDTSYEKMGELMSFQPKVVQVQIHYTTGIDNPAFYSLESDTITLAAEKFMETDPKVSPRDREVRRAFSGHMAQHEYVHLLFAHRLGYEGFRDSKVGLPLWVIEGVAEYASGGIGSIPRTPAELVALFKDGFLSTTELTRQMSVVNGSKDSNQNLKAYVQSYYMVKFLMQLRGSPQLGMESFIAFSKKLLETQQLESSFAAVYEMDIPTFERGWQRQIRGDLLTADPPVLESWTRFEPSSAPPAAPAGDDVSAAN